MRKFFIMRHALAEDRQVFLKTGLSDDERPLTPEGTQKLQLICQKLKSQGLEFNTVIQSPLVRSQQTAKIVAATFKTVKTLTLENLRPDKSIDDVIHDLNHLSIENAVVIGHEDQLSRLTCYMLTGETEKTFLYFKKAGLARLSYDKKIIPGKVTLDWLLTPKTILSK